MSLRPLTPSVQAGEEDGAQKTLKRKKAESADGEKTQRALGFLFEPHPTDRSSHLLCTCLTHKVPL